MENKLYTITVFSENTVGVLNQITIIFTRRGLNIETFSGSPSAINGIHKLTITLYTTPDMVKKVVQQIDKRVDIIKAYYNTDDELIYREIALYKVATDKFMAASSIQALVHKYNVRVLEITESSIVFSKTGHYEETQELFEELKKTTGVLQFIRSGKVAITRSKVEKLSDMLEGIREIEAKQKE